MKRILSFFARLTHLLAGCVYGDTPEPEPVPAQNAQEDSGPFGPWSRFIRGEELRPFLPPGVILVDFPILKVADPTPRCIPLLSHEFTTHRDSTLSTLMLRLKSEYDYPGRSLYVYSVRPHKDNETAPVRRFMVRLGSYTSHTFQENQ